MYQEIFKQGKIGNITLKNRLVMSPMGTSLAEMDGSPSEDMIAFYEARAIGGAALIIPEIARVNDLHGAGMMRQLSVSKDRHIEGLAKLAETVHKYGTKIFIQLHHPGRETVTALTGGPVVSASAIPCKYLQQETRALSTEEVKALIQQFISGAVRVKKAGCDGVELHAAHGYLLQQFLSPYTNKREDEYGGSFENRLRMITEIINGIRVQCGPDFPIGVRLSVEEFLDKTGVTEDYIHIQDGVKIAMALEKCGIDFIDVSVGLYETGSVCVEPISFPQGWRKDLIKAVKDHVSIPVIGVSCIREPQVAESFLEGGIVDFVSMGRSWLADEQWGLKVLEGRENEICKCINCLRCFESLNAWMGAGIPAECAVNPRACRERLYGNAEFEKLGVELKLDMEATADKIAEMNPDAVLVATGSKSVIPGSIPGITGENVYTIEDILSGKAGLKNKKVMIIGAGVTGLETAEYLCHEGNTVVLADMLDKVAPNANHTNVADVCGRLKEYNAQFMMAYALKEIKKDGVVLERLNDKINVEVAADAVVLSLGFRPDNHLVEELKEKGIHAQAIGNAVKDGTIAPASRSGFEAARKLFKTSVKTPSFITAPEEMPNFGKISLMKNQEGIYLAYLTDPAAIAKVLPAPLKPFSVPVVTVSVCHVKEPTFADDYYEAILGVYCTYGTQLGLYPIGLVLGGTGAEMAVQCGRDNGSIPKKLGSEFVIRRNNDHVTAQVCRRGTELVNIDLKIGEYNNAMTGMLYQFPEAGKKTYGGGFYFHLDREPDKEGKSHFQNGALLQNLCEYNYHSWEPGFAAIKLQSSIDDPWGELPIRTVIGGAYSSNDLMVHKLNLCEEIDADVLAPYLLTARYDRTAFMETGRR